jgi:hypothetical protein
MTKPKSLPEQVRNYIYDGGRIHTAVMRSAPVLIAKILSGPPAMSLRSLAEAVDLSPTYLSLVKNRKVQCSLGAYLSLVQFAEGNRL